MMSCSENECRWVVSYSDDSAYKSYHVGGNSPELSVAVEAVRTSAGVWCHVAISPHTSLSMLEGSCPKFSVDVEVT